MKKLIIFDLDGVLVDSKDIHHLALNRAIEMISPQHVISSHDQKNIYEGLPTKTKLKILTERSGLSVDLHEPISKIKQDITIKMFSELDQDDHLISLLKKIKQSGIKIAVASNSIRKTVDICLIRLGINNLIDHVFSNEDVINPKPHPEIYWKTMSYFNVISEETVIFEDSIVGKIAATDSKAFVIPVKNRLDLTDDKIDYAIKHLQNAKTVWRDKMLNVLIPMAGAGSRFEDAGYAFPKPLIDVNGKPMIQAVVDNLAIDAKYTFIVQEKHYEKYNLSYLLNLIAPNCNIVQVNGVTEGAAVTALLAKDFIDNENPLILANSDQIVDWNSREFLYDLVSKNADGGIATFKATHPKWSYAKVNNSGIVTEVAEKKPISDDATVGIYYWKHGSDFIKYAKQMIDKNIRVNNEFYICPVFNEAIEDGKNIYALPVKNMWGVGTPEDLQNYLLYSNHVY